MKSTRQVILNILEKEASLPTSQLVEMVLSQDSGRNREEVLQNLTQLHAEGKLSMRPPHFSSFRSFFLDTAWNTNFWAVLVTCAGYAIQFWIPSQRLPPGLLLLFYLPGCSLLRAIVNNHYPFPVGKYILEIALSLALTMLLGLLLNFTPEALLSAKTQASIVGLNLVLAFAASLTDYREKYSVRLARRNASCSRQNTSADRPHNRLASFSKPRHHWR